MKCTNSSGILRFKRMILSRPDEQTWWSSTKTERTCRIVNIAVPIHHRIKLKGSKTKDKLLNLARELKKLWNMKVMVIPIEISVVGTVTKGLIQGLEELEVRGRVETIQTIALLRSARILRRGLETRGHSQLLRLENHQLTLLWKISKEKNNSLTTFSTLINLSENITCQV